MAAAVSPPYLAISKLRLHHLLPSGALRGWAQGHFSFGQPLFQLCHLGLAQQEDGFWLRPPSIQRCLRAQGGAGRWRRLVALEQSTSKQPGERPGFVISLPSPQQWEIINFHTAVWKQQTPKQLCRCIPSPAVVGVEPQTKKEKRRERKTQQAGDQPRSGVTGFQAAICICRDLPEHSSYTWAHRECWLTINLFSPEERCFPIGVTHKSNAVGSCKTSSWTTLTSYLCVQFQQLSMLYSGSRSYSKKNGFFLNLVQFFLNTLLEEAILHCTCP